MSLCVPQANRPQANTGSQTEQAADTKSVCQAVSMPRSDCQTQMEGFGSCVLREVLENKLLGFSSWVAVGIFEEVKNNVSTLRTQAIQTGVLSYKDRVFKFHRQP